MRRNGTGRTVARAALIAAALSGCEGTEVKLQEAPPAAIAPVQERAATSDKSDLKKGAPPKGSSAGLNFNPSQTGPAR